MKAILNVKMLGWLSAEAGNTAITRFRTRKTSALFSYLAFYSELSHPRELLAEMLWPDKSTDASRNSLSQALTSLRQQLGRAGRDACALLQADRTNVQLVGTTDTAEFEAAMKLGSGRDERIAALTHAISLYGGDLLPAQYDEWVMRERTRLRGLFLQGCHELTGLLLSAGAHQQAASVAHRAVQSDPLSECAARDLMQVHLEAREPSFALRVYRNLEEALEREVGERPSSETAALARRIAAISIAAISEEVPAPQQAHAVGATVTGLLVHFRAPSNPSASWAGALAKARNHAKLAFARFGGIPFGEGAGSETYASFAQPLKGLDCAVQIREELRRVCWPDGRPIEVGLAVSTFMDKPGRRVDDCAADLIRLRQLSTSPAAIILGEATAALLRSDLAPGLSLMPLAIPDAGRCYEVRFATLSSECAATSGSSAVNSTSEESTRVLEVDGIEIPMDGEGRCLDSASVDRQ